MLMNLLKYSLFVAVILLSGCGPMYIATPDDPRYAPLIPDVAKAPIPENGSLFTNGTGLVLYQDAKANQIGDILTVELTETTKASKDSKTGFKKKYSNDSKDPTIFGKNPISAYFKKIPFTNIKSPFGLEQDIETEGEFNGSGDSSQNNSLSGNITVTIAEVLPNNNFVIRGEKWLTLNQGSEYIRLSGIVRPQDINAANKVPSHRIANARITYSGKGAIADSNAAGWLARFFNHPLYPF